MGYSSYVTRLEKKYFPKITGGDFNLGYGPPNWTALAKVLTKKEFKKLVEKWNEATIKSHVPQAVENAEDLVELYWECA